MSTAFDWPRISIQSQGRDWRPIGSQTKYFLRHAGTNDAGWALWNNLALATSGTVATAPYLANLQHYAFSPNSWLVEAIPDSDIAPAASGTVRACSWYAPNFSSWLVDTVPESIDVGQQSSAVTVLYDVSLGTGAEWLGRFYGADKVRVERALAPKEPAKIDEFVVHGTAIRAVAEHFLRGTRDLSQKERSFLTRFYSRAYKKGK